MSFVTFLLLTCSHLSDIYEFCNVFDMKKMVRWANKKKRLMINWERDNEIRLGVTCTPPVLSFEVRAVYSFPSSGSYPFFIYTIDPPTFSANFIYASHLSLTIKTTLLHSSSLLAIPFSIFFFFSNTIDKCLNVLLKQTHSTHKKLSPATFFSLLTQKMIMHSTFISWIQQHYSDKSCHVCIYL